MVFFIGLISGIFGGLVGLGGAGIMIPLMTRLAGLTQHQVHGTSLVAVVFAGVSGGMAYAQKGFVDWRAVLILAVAASVTARFGARYCVSLPGWKLRKFFGIFLIVVSALLFGKPLLDALTFSPLTGLWKDLSLVVIGLATGFIAGLLGIGGGVLMVPAMVLITGMTQHIAQGSSLFCLMAAGTVGAYTHWRKGNVVLRILLGLVSGIVLGAYLGGSVANFLPEEVLRTLFAVVLILLGVDLIRKSPLRKNDSREE